MNDLQQNIKGIEDIDSSLNEIDIEISNIIHKLLLIADPRCVEKNPDVPLWARDRVMLVDELDTQEIFNAYLISNTRKNIDITYPLCGIHPNDIDEVFYGTGNRIGQWEFIANNDRSEFKVGSSVYIIKGKNKGLRGTILDIYDDSLLLKVKNIELIEDIINCKSTTSSTYTFKAKQFQTTYDIAILVDNKKEARYLQDKFILRCADGHIWHPFKSTLLNGTESYIFTVFGIPNINRYPASEDKLTGSGYIYGISFKANVWAILADEPLPTHIIEQIRLNIHNDNEARINRITIN